MKINKDIIKKLNPCNDRYNNYLDNYTDFDGDIKDFILLQNISYTDKVWVFTRIATPIQNVKWSLLCASKVLSIFETAYPEDKRPRLALEAVEVYLLNPTQTTTNAASIAAAYAATNAAANAAADAANAAVNAAYAASYAANAAYAANATNAYAASYAANAAAHAVEATAYAANTAANAEKSQQKVNLLLMIEALEK